jgi:hypothetical protein
LKLEELIKPGVVSIGANGKVSCFAAGWCGYFTLSRENTAACMHSVPGLSLRGAQRRSNPARWFATPWFLGLAMTNRPGWCTGPALNQSFTVSTAAEHVSGVAAELVGSFPTLTLNENSFYWRVRLRCGAL